MSDKKKVVVAGATGLIGKELCEELQKKNYDVVIITRDTTTAQKALPHLADYITWSDEKGVEAAVDHAYGIINLAGSPIVGKRWTPAYKKVILTSRINTTKQIVAAITKTEVKPKVFINGSAVGYYGFADKIKIYDESFPVGADFLSQICLQWETEAQKATQSGIRVVLIRTAINLDKHEGALPRMLMPFYFYLGGPIGSGKQWFPWVHVKDEVGIICYALENEKVSGAVNAVAPEAITNKELSVEIGKVLQRPSFFPLPIVVLRLLFGEAAVVLSTGVKISPQKIIDLGYEFQFPKLSQALQNILAVKHPNA